MDKRVMIGIGALVLVALVAGAYYYSTKQKPSPINNQSSESPGVDGVLSSGEDNNSPPFDESAKPGTTDITITGSSFKFDLGEIRVREGETVTIIFKNAEGVHDWHLDGYNIGTKVIKAGEQDVVQFKADKVGTFEYYCSVAYHRQMGMKGSFVVEAN